MRRIVWLFFLIVALLVAACSGQPTPAAQEQPAAEEPVEEAPAAEATEEPAAPTEEAMAEVTEEPVEPAGDGAASIKIGVLNPTTGNFAIFGEQVNTGMRLYFDSIGNQINGVPVELVLADTAGDPQQALDQARRLVEQEQVDLLTGIINSAVVVPVAQYADQQQVPLIITVGGAQAATGAERSPYVFRTAMVNGQQDRPLGWYAASELGSTNAVIFAWDFLVGEERGGAFAETFTAAGGTIVAEQKPPLGTTDYGPFISQVDPASVDVAYAFFAGPGAISFLQQMREFGLTPDLQVVAADYFTAGVLEPMGDTAEGLVQGGQYSPSLDNPENQAFLEMFAAEVGGEPGVYVEEGYLGAMVTATALTAVGGDLSDEQAFLDALAALELDTPSGPFRFDENGQSVRNVYITRVVAQDGAFVQEVIATIEGVSQDWTPE